MIFVILYNDFKEEYWTVYQGNHTFNMVSLNQIEPHKDNTFYYVQ